MTKIATTGDAVLLFQKFMNTAWYGIMGDGSTPAGFAATMEAVDDEAVITFDVLKGDKGEKGDPAPLVDLQWPPLEQPADLDQFRDELGPDDKGKAWWIGTVVYVWTGDTFQMVRPGPAGPTGATPNVSFEFETIPQSERDENPDVKETTVKSGNALNPHFKVRLLAPRGPVGPSTNINNAPDYDNSGGAPDNGQTLVWNANLQKWQPSDFTAKHPRLYSVPEAAFTPFTGLAQRQSILQYRIPPQDFAWTPYVTGHIQAYGIELDADPLTIGVEVRLGDAMAGQLIGRGFGNSSHWSTIAPHWSTPQDRTNAVAPDNGVATVQAGEEARINVNLYNDGLLGAYVFSGKGAQLAVLVVPQGL
ncbi:minor tail protein [Mycobacterium phage OkiRoe]|uniref:Minor tail protein n=1 Tax=Mycobacterium phage Gengar TaxID=1891963 RepID=A0A1C9EGQ4_9CAUD|nr:minor tail protein [Mycobacterium phage OkiRoe]YP_009282268.1 minor tail protein [Mycobacterium phage Gengar]QXN73766.1 minor tail protein [Mycobacterium phage SoSeph]WNM65493.1 minor tail protein [Mycobacterium phage Heftyboy]AHZ95584.1 minor tail protein [Mycobacterium phage OkiRoe]AON96678.1 minor tail protein [Mycobacterium phage Gengar]